MELTFATFTVMSLNLLRMPHCDIISNGTHSSVLQSQVFLHSRLICAKLLRLRVLTSEYEKGTQNENGQLLIIDRVFTRNRK